MGLPILFRLHSHKGITLIEISVVLVILGLFFSSVIPICVDRINRAKYEKMINEMTSIAQASIDYYKSQDPNTWPDPTHWASQISSSTVGTTKYLYNAVTTNPWGRSYELIVPNASNNYNDLVIVSTAIPPGIGQMTPEGPMVTVLPGTGTIDGQVTIALSVPNAGIGRLQYEKKYLYNQ